MAASDHLGRQFLPMKANVLKNIGIIAHEPSDSEEDLRREDLSLHYQEQQHPLEMYDLPASTPLHTTQVHVEKSGIRKYVDHPHNPEEFIEGEGYNAPQVYHHKGKMWIMEGHHRFIASRLRGEKSTPVHSWSTGE